MTSLSNRIKYAVATAGLIGAVGAVSVASAAQPTTSPGMSGYARDTCRDYATLGFKNHGQCVSYFAKAQHH